MVPKVFSDRPDVVPHFVPLWEPGGFHGCDLPPVLPGAGNPRRPPFHSRLARAFPLAAGFATGDMTESSHGAASSSASADRSFAWRRSCMLADRGRRRARGPKRARPTAVACHGQVGVKGADSMARSASRGRPRWPGPPRPWRQVVDTSALSPSESDVRGRGTPGVPLTAGGRRRPWRRPWRAVSATAAVPGTGAAAGISPGARMAAARRMTTAAQP